MTADLHLFPLHRRDGEDTTDPLPGLHLATPPRKAARSRQSDQLLLHLTFTGTATLNDESHTQLLKRLADTYYQTSGAATSALRTLVENVNALLLDRNLRAESKGLQAAGLLTAMILRQDQLLIGQSGPTHVFVVEENQYRHLYDPQTAGHGLGLGRNAGLLINYVPNQPDTLLLLSPAPPAAWENPALQTAFGRPLRAIQRGLLKPAGPDLNALLIQVQSGPGKIHLHKTVPVEPDASRPTESVMEMPEQEMAPPPIILPALTESSPEPEESQPEPDGVAVAEAESQPEAVTGSASPVSQPPDQPATHQAPTKKPAYRQPTKQPTNKPTNLQKQLGSALLTVGRATREAFRQIGYTLRSLLTRLLPGSELFTIPSSTMAFIAIAIPIILVTIAFFVYHQRGRNAQYVTYLQYAEAAKTNAQGKTTPEDLRTAWNAVLFYVNQAETYQTTGETQTIRLEAQTVLDQMDAVARLEYVPVLQTPLAENVVIRKIASTSENVYLLNEDGGNVVRVWQSGRGYETDLTFRCGPLPNESLIVGPLVDIAALPPVNAFDARVLGMDANGILVYCLHDEPPVAVPLITPDNNWGNPLAFALDNDILYVLDPQTNAVWVYYGDNYEFSDRPRFFFDADVPPMADVIDLAVDRGELYLLHADGHLTACAFGFDVQPTRCTDPAPLTDPRPGQESGPTLAGTIFSEIVFTPPPDPSLYLLDPIQQAVYHLSLQLTLQRQLRPQIIDSPARNVPSTAFAISPNRTIYLAFGNQVWVGSLP